MVTERRTRRALARPRGDDGAMAVFISILLVLVLLPATALGLTSYTRSAVQAEKARAADSGALAGAAALVLLDVAEIPLNPLASLPTEGVAFSKATAACNTAAAADKELSEDYATPVSCLARYSPDTTFASCADALFNLLPLPTTVVVPPLLPGGLPLPVDPNGLVNGLLSDGVVLDLRRTAKALVPGLLHNGVTVTLRYRVQGPLDALLPGPGETDGVAVATARRRFKPLLPPAFGINGLVNIDPEDYGVYSALASTLRTLETVAGEGTTPLVVPLPFPQLDPVGVLPSSCRPALLEVIRDLRDGLKPNPVETDALTCLGQKVLGVAALAPLNTLDDLCLAKVFRAQLAPSA